MQVIRFTKFWPELTVEQMGERAAGLGYDGFDLAVRDGHPVTPGNIGEVLPRAMRVWETHGLGCPLITAGVDCNDPADPAAIRLFEHAGEAGVANIKIGYFQFQPGSDFGQAWDSARRAMSGFEALARRTGVRALYHTHSGLVLGSNCAGLRHLLEGLDPALVGAYPDLGHLAINGEQAAMALAMVEPYIGALAAKDARHIPATSGDGGSADARAGFVDGFVMLGEGAAEVEEAIEFLKERRFAGPLSVHTEYTMDQEVIATVGGVDASDQAKALRERGEVQDLAFLRRLITAH